ncbi:MAG: hypothetical protein WBI32_00655 [Halanaerobiales bacterium]
MAILQDRGACPNINVNKKECSCFSTNCSRHGFCCACIEYHRKNGGLPACLK